MVVFNVTKKPSISSSKMTLCAVFFFFFSQVLFHRHANSSTNSFSITLTASSENNVPWPLTKVHANVKSVLRRLCGRSPALAHTVSTPSPSRKLRKRPVAIRRVCNSERYLVRHKGAKSCSMRKKAIKIDSLSPSHNIKFVSFIEFFSFFLLLRLKNTPIDRVIAIDGGAP